jgi:hypothetical protein
MLLAFRIPSINIGEAQRGATPKIANSIKPWVDAMKKKAGYLVKFVLSSKHLLFSR